MQKKWWLWLIPVLLVVGTAGGWWYFSTRAAAAQSEDEPAVQTAVARRGELVVFASGTGETIPTAQIDLGFAESGTVTEVLVKPGDIVAAGQVLARLASSRTPAALALDTAAAALAVQQKEQAIEDLHIGWAQALAEAELALETAQDNLAAAQDPELARAQAWQAVLAAQGSLADAEAAYNSLQTVAVSADVDAAYASLLLALNELSKAQDRYAPYANKAEDNLTRANLLAQLSAAQEKYDRAVYTYNALIGGATDFEQASAQADMQAAQASLAAAQQKYERLQSGPVAADVSLAAAGLAAAQVAYDRLKDGPAPVALAAAEAELGAAQAELSAAQAAQHGIELVAPAAATVLAVETAPGASVATNPVVTLADLSQPLVEVYLDESDLDKIAVGYDAEVIFDAFPERTFPGTVVQVNPAITRESNVPVLTARVLLEAQSLPNGQPLPLGLNAAVDVIGGRTENAVLVPVEALREIGPGEYAVFVMQDGEPRLRVVQVGLQDITSVEISAGLEAGEVVTTGVVETQ